MTEKKRLAKKRNLNATVAKMHAVYGKRLKQEDYAALMNCTTVAEAAGYLKHSTYFSDVLEGIDTDNIHRGNLEDILRRSLIEKYSGIIGFEKISGDEFYNYMIIKTEIDEILICILHLNAGTDDHINTLPIYMNRYTSFNLMELAQVRTFSELLSLTEKTEYHNILKKFKPEQNSDGRDGHIDYVSCELELRTYYSRRLVDSLKIFGSKTEKHLRSYIGTQIDMVNIINSYRMTRYFNADAEDIKKRMIPIYLRLPEKTLDQIHHARDKDEFVRIFSGTSYGRESAAQGFDMNDPEMVLSQLRFKQAKRAFSSSQAAPECFYTFITLAEMEIKNIIRIIEGIRYSLTAKEISELIVY